MGKFYEASSSFSYPWHEIAKAFWSRYPNPHSSHVLSEDTLYREIRQGCLYTRRLLTKTNRLPKWGERFLKSSVVINPYVAIIEESYVDPDKKTITTYTRNVGLTRIMSVVEKVIYRPNPQNQGETIAQRSAWIDSQLYGFRRAIEGFGLQRFRKNCTKAVLGFNHVLEKEKSRLYGRFSLVDG